VCSFPVHDRSLLGGDDGHGTGRGDALGGPRPSEWRPKTMANEDPPPHADSWNARTRAAQARRWRKLMGSASSAGNSMAAHLRRTNNHAVNGEQGGGGNRNSSPVRPSRDRTPQPIGGGPGGRRQTGAPGPGCSTKSAKMGGYVGSSITRSRRFAARASEQSEGSRPGPADRPS